MQIYQDVWVNGKVRQKGIRGCDADRYEVIREHCKQYTRPFTILDIGACLGYFSFRLSTEFNCTSIMVEAEKHYVNALAGPLIINTNIISGLIRQQKCKGQLNLLSKRLNLVTLKRISECEHFDVVLALRVVHHFKEPFSDIIDAIVSLGDFTFFELPTNKETEVRTKGRVRKELADHSRILGKYEYRKVGEFPIHVGPSLSPMYLVKHKKTKITRPYYDSPRTINHRVKSVFGQKLLVKREKHPNRGKLKTAWVPGINLYTFHRLGGVFPSRQYISSMVAGYNLPRNSPLTDISMWNFIIGGKKLTLIDHTSVNDSKGRPFANSNPRAKLRTVSKEILRK